jgi:hypothetical protein
MAEGWFRQIDAYCERTDPSFWAEPVNAVTNVAFLLGAFVAFRLWRREAPDDRAIAVLLLLVAAIGIGSFLFHTLATLWAMLADVIPITLFIVAYLMLAVRRFLERPWWQAIVAGLAFVPLATLLEGAVGAFVGDLLNGSEGYLPAFLALVGFGLWLDRRGRPAGRALLVAAALFLVSLAFRTADEAVCAALPLGTHFMWHTLNGVLLAYLVVAMIRHGRPAPA